MQCFSPGPQQDQLSREVTELFPGLYLASYLTASEPAVAGRGVEAVVEISSRSHDSPALTSQLHVRLSETAHEENFDRIADFVSDCRERGGAVLISCQENCGLAATLATAYGIKYAGLSARRAAEVAGRARPGAVLDPQLVDRLAAWEWKLRRERLFRQATDIHIDCRQNILRIEWLYISR